MSQGFIKEGIGYGYQRIITVVGKDKSGIVAGDWANSRIGLNIDDISNCLDEFSR